MDKGASKAGQYLQKTYFENGKFCHSSLFFFVSEKTKTNFDKDTGENIDKYALLVTEFAEKENDRTVQLSVKTLKLSYLQL